MHKTLAALLLALSAVTLSVSSRDLEAVDRAVSNSVYIDQGTVGGSGTLFVRTNSLGERLVLVVTAGHVIEAGSKTNAWSVILPQDGTNSTTFFACAVDFCAKAPSDVGILLLTGTNQPPAAGAQAKLSGFVRQGEEIFSVSSPYGLRHAQSVDFGTVGHLHRRIDGVRMFQMSCVIAAGSSGGGVFTSDGLWIGSTACVLIPGIGFAVPIDTYHAWLCSKNLGWVLDPSIPAPTRAEIIKNLIP